MNTGETCDYLNSSCPIGGVSFFMYKEIRITSRFAISSLYCLVSFGGQYFLQSQLFSRLYSQTKMCAAFGPGNDMFESSRIIGESIYTKAKVFRMHW